MHKNEIRYLSDDELREVFKETLKHIESRNIDIEIPIDMLCKQIDKLDFDHSIDIEEATKLRQLHLQATKLEDMEEYRKFTSKDGKRCMILGDLLTYEEFWSNVQSGCMCSYDGYGKWCYADKVSDLEYQFYNKVLEDEDIIKKYGFTHILWFNK